MFHGSPLPGGSYCTFTMPGASMSLRPLAGWKVPPSSPVEAHDEVDQIVRRGQPVALLVLSGRVLLDVKGERAILILLHVGSIGELMSND